MTPEAFWSRVLVGDPDQCWPWTGSKDSDGYGKLPPSDRWAKAHRVAFRLSTGADAAGMVLHSCDNPACCNPAHLRDGTAADNVQDMLERGRLAVGSKVGSAKLTEADVAVIRARLADGDTQQQIAADFGVARSSISHIATGARWRRAR